MAKIDKVYYVCDCNDAREIDLMKKEGIMISKEEVQVDSKECRELYKEYASLDRELY